MPNYDNFKKCPGCKKHTKGAYIYVCANCGYKGCLDAGWLSWDGCFSKPYCPNCNKSGTRSDKAIGYIYE